jgi:hypothetical protein
MRRLPVVAVLILLGACASLATLAPPPQHRLAYEYGLSEVVRPAKTQQRYGAQRITTVTDTGVAKYSFEDELVRIVIYPYHDRVYFNLVNKTSNSLKIIWNDAAFVGLDGASEPVMHVGVKYTDCRGQKASSVVIQQGRVSDSAIPCSNVSFFSGAYTGGWYITPLIPTTHFPVTDTTSKLAEARASHVGQKIKFLLPIQVEDVTNDYLFTFDVKAVKSVPGNVLDYKVP